jgi:threonine aldolase
MNHHSQQFASDNYAGICPEAMEYLVKANIDHEQSYGDDKWTAETANLFRNLFETDCEVFFVFNGTAANSLSLSTLCQSYHSIICHEYAHIETDECGAPEFFSNGAKILLIKGEQGKLTGSGISEVVTKRSDIHYPKPKVVSITQATEAGTVYSKEELRAIVETAKQYGMFVHMDGARLANAVVTLNVKPKEITWQCGIDVLCFGGVKNGLAVGEAVIFFNKKLADEFAYRCKQAGQLCSKMRFMSAPWLGLLKNDVWLKNARHANQCAALLEEKLKRFKEISIMFPRHANALFLSMPPALNDYLHQKRWHFYSFIAVGGVRLMCSWDTREEYINRFVQDIEEGLRLLSKAGNKS